jgi:cytosine/adenosine deaminase-related metal-dependent hydrolase
MYTTWGAFAGFKENEIGKLKKGYQADLIILDKDISRAPVKDLLNTQVLRTYVRGEQVFNKPGFLSARKTYKGGLAVITRTSAAAGMPYRKIKNKIKWGDGT